MAENIVVLEYEGQSYHLKKNLTVGETLKLSGKRFSLTNGQYDALAQSEIAGDKNMAFLADIVVELDARILKAPDDWQGAEKVEDTKKLLGLWKLWVQESGFFRKPIADAEDTTARGLKSEGEEKPSTQLDENLVQEEIQSVT